MQKNRFRIWDETDKEMIYPEGEVGITGEWPSLLAMGIHGLPIAIDKDSFKKEREIIGWNIDHNRVPMRSTSLQDRDEEEIWEGDLRIYEGRLYKVVDDGWRFRLERNLVEFGENHEVVLDEDVAYKSKLAGNFYEDAQYLLNNHKK